MSRSFRLYSEEPVKGEPEPDDEDIGDYDPTKAMMNIEFVTLDKLHDILVAEIPNHPEIGRVREVVSEINFRVKAIKSMVKKIRKFSKFFTQFLNFLNRDKVPKSRHDIRYRFDFKATGVLQITVGMVRSEA